MDKNNTKILIVDDISMVRIHVKSILKKNIPVNIKEAADGVEAVIAFKEFDPDIVLLDLRLPKIGGLDLIRVFLNINKKIKILIISAIDKLDIQVKALQKGAIAYLVKPIVEHLLIKKLNELIDSKDDIHEDIIEDIALETQDKPEKIGIKLDAGNSLQILDIYGIFNNEEMIDLEKIILSLQDFYYNHVIVNFNNISEFNADTRNMIKLKDQVEKKKGEFSIILSDEKIKNKLDNLISDGYIVKTEKQALEKIK